MECVIEGTEKEILPGVFQYTRSTDHARITEFKATDILIKHLSGRITINSAGYRTEEMRKVLNKLLKPFHIKELSWIVKVGYREYPFVDGMSIHQSYYVGYVKERRTFHSYDDYATRNDKKQVEKVFSSLEEKDQWKDKVEEREQRQKEEALFQQNREIRRIKRRLIKGKDSTSQGLVNLIALLEDDAGDIA